MDALWDASEGLPLYLASAMATPPDPSGDASRALPGGVRAVLSERLARVDGVAAQVLAAAAAIGRAFEVPTLRYASGRSDDEVLDALDVLAARGLIRESGEAEGTPTYDFTHGALRDLAEESTSLARRRLLHRRIAEAIRLDAAGAARDDPAQLARIARHEREAGRDAEAAAAFGDAGEAAARVYANREAIDAYEAALALGHPAPAELHARVGDLRTRIGDYAARDAGLRGGGGARRSRAAAAHRGCACTNAPSGRRPGGGRRAPRRGPCRFERAGLAGGVPR